MAIHAARGENIRNGNEFDDLMNYKLAIMGTIIIFYQSCEFGYSESFRRSDANGDGKADRIEY